MDARQQNKGRVCSVDGCGRSAVAKGLCKPHYDMQRDHGRTDYQPVLMKTTKCTAEGCDALARQKGLCDRHYQRLRKYGDPNHVPAKVTVNGGPCSVSGCTARATTRGLCKAHYSALLRHGDPAIRKNNSIPKPCSVEGCEKLTTRTYCSAHESRFRRYGDATYKPPKVRDGICAMEGCDRQAHTAGLCRAHYTRSRLQRAADAPALPSMLTDEQLDFIRQNRNVIRHQELADQLHTTVHTVIAVQAGRNWGRGRAKPKT